MSSLTRRNRTQRAGTGPDRPRAVARALALAALLSLPALACGADSGRGEEAERAPVSSPTATDGSGPGGTSAEARIDQVNETMRNTPFSGIGTTTAFDEGLQQIRWNPEQGLHIKLTGISGDDMYCKDGVTYTSAGLLALSLESKGVRITVPARLDDVYVTTESEQGCDSYFAVPSGVFAPDKDKEIEGVPAQAVVASSGAASDVYYLSEKDPARLLRMESVRNGRRSGTTYVDFGKATTVTLPDTDRVMTMEEFRAEVDAD